MVVRLHVVAGRSPVGVEEDQIDVLVRALAEDRERVTRVRRRVDGVCDEPVRGEVSVHRRVDGFKPLTAEQPVELLELFARCARRDNTGRRDGRAGLRGRVRGDGLPLSAG